MRSSHDYILWTDDSPESDEARKLVTEWANAYGVNFMEYKEGPKVHTDDAPALDTPIGPYDGLGAIRIFTRVAPGQVETLIHHAANAAQSR